MVNAEVTNESKCPSLQLFKSFRYPLLNLRIRSAALLEHLGTAPAGNCGLPPMSPARKKDATPLSLLSTATK